MTYSETRHFRNIVGQLPYNYFSYDTDTRELMAEGSTIAVFEDNPLAIRCGMQLAAISKDRLLSMLDTMLNDKKAIEAYKQKCYELESTIREICREKETLSDQVHQLKGQVHALKATT